MPVLIADAAPWPTTTLKAAASGLNVDPEYLKELIKAGHIHAVRVPGNSGQRVLLLNREDVRLLGVQIAKRRDGEL